MLRKIIAVLLAALLLSGCAFLKPKPQLYEITWLDVFDTVTTLRGYETSQQAFHETAERVHETLVYFHQAFDIYHPSEQPSLYTVNQNAGIAPVALDPQIIAFLTDCREAYTLTGGRVNIAMGSVLQLWHEARTQALDAPETAALPDRAALEEAAAHISFDTVQIDAENNTVFLADPAQRLDVGAIAKGWAAQKACALLPEGYLLNLGGNICARGSKPDDAAWKIGVQSPDDPGSYMCLVGIRGTSAVTSGDYQRFFTVDGVNYHHIIDPDTLNPAQFFRSVTILCPDSGLADCLSTALFLMPLEEGMALAQRCGADALWIAADGTVSMTDGFREIAEFS